MVKNPPVMRDLGSIPGWEGRLAEGMTTYSSTLAWRIPMDRGAWRATVPGVTKSQIQLSDSARQGWINMFLPRWEKAMVKIFFLERVVGRAN